MASVNNCYDYYYPVVRETPVLICNQAMGNLCALLHTDTLRRLKSFSLQGLYAITSYKGFMPLQGLCAITSYMGLMPIYVQGLHANFSRAICHLSTAFYAICFKGLLCQMFQGLLCHMFQGFNANVFQGFYAVLIKASCHFIKDFKSFC